jgi:hypothetical protein
MMVMIMGKFDTMIAENGFYYAEATMIPRYKFRGKTKVVHVTTLDSRSWDLVHEYYLGLVGTIRKEPI